MRFIVIGTSGSGKSTFARSLAAARRSPYVELDELSWLPNWTQRSSQDLRQRVLAVTSGETWVVDGNYSAVRDAIWPRATDVVWLDFSRFTVHSRVIWRTFMRAATRKELWAGNRESFTKALFSKDSILLWSFTTFASNRSTYTALRESGEFPHLAWHRLRRPGEADEFLLQHRGDAC